MQKDGTVRELQLDHCNAEDVSLSIWSDILYASVTHDRSGIEPAGTDGIAMTPDFRVVHRYRQVTDAVYAESVKMSDSFAAFIFPVQIVQDVPGSSFRYPQIRYADVVPAALSGSIFSLVIFALISRLGSRKRARFDYALVSVFGFTALLLLLLSEADEYLSFVRRN